MTAAGRLSQIDAFFVAYQQATGILMQHGVEAELGAVFTEDQFARPLQRLLARWPQLGKTVRAGYFGLVAGRTCALDEICRRGTDEAELPAWRNTPIDPFREPPFQILWIPREHSTIIACRTHHCVADAEAMSAVCLDAMRSLAILGGGGTLPPVEPAPHVRLAHLAPWNRRRGRLLTMAELAKHFFANTRAPAPAGMALPNASVGPVAGRELLFAGETFARLKQIAIEAQTSTLMLCAAAWLRAVHAWNRNAVWNRSDNPQIAIEFPVTLRRGRRDLDACGNFISPVILSGDGNAPLLDTARDLERQLMELIGTRAHWVMPLVTSPGRFVPWWLFRRLAASVASTGSATTHFTWLEPPTDIRREMLELSHGRVPLLRQSLYSPVCRLMGAAIVGLAWPDQLQLFLTYRQTAFSESDADTLLGLLQDELEQLAAPSPALLEPVA